MQDQKRYDYQELLEKAMKPRAEQSDIETLAEWFWMYGENYWNGDYFEIDCFHVLRPIYEEDENGDYKIVRHEISYS